MNIVDWAVETMNSLGAFGVFLLIFAENLFPPIPSEVILPLAGVASARPENSYWMMLLASVAGSVVGAWVLYGLGRLLGPERLRKIVIWLPLVHVEDYDKSVAFMDKHGHKAIFFGRFVPGVRSLISIPAGLYAMPIAIFTLLTAAGSAIWNTIFLTIGYFMGSNWTVIEPYTDIFSKVAYAVVALVILWFVVRLILREKKRRELGLPDPDEKYLQEDAQEPSQEDSQKGPHGDSQGDAQTAGHERTDGR
ncbi:DedA family protein [Brachybacterium sp. AOP42-C2-15]|uniref:DedA family protein n=1 Tax=unclassified Brachybacterium TaxID=2623841 RepID=UPI004034EBC2